MVSKEQPVFSKVDFYKNITNMSKLGIDPFPKYPPVRDFRRRPVSRKKTTDNRLESAYSHQSSHLPHQNRFISTGSPSKKGAESPS